MSDIKAGDLVMLVKPRPCGCPPVHIGTPYTVIETMLAEWECGECGFVTPLSLLAHCDTRRGWIQAYRLIKIPPASPEHVEHREELTA